MAKMVAHGDGPISHELRRAERKVDGGPKRQRGQGDWARAGLGEGGEGDSDD